MDSVQLKKLSKVDVKELQALVVKTYRDTYKHNLTNQEIETRILARHQTKDFLNLFGDPNQIFWGLYTSNLLIAYLQLSIAENCSLIPNFELLKIYRIYVHPSFKGKGFGRLLMKKAEEVCSENSLQGLWLHCFDQNRAAIQFYEREGYELVGKEPFEIIPGLQRFDVVMVKKLAK